MKLTRERFIDIDCAKAFAIILVVLGHVVARDYPQGDEWFMYVKNTIYTFHMPLFIFLSGLIFYHVYPKSGDAKHIIEYILKRAYRLLVPFFLLGFIIILGKYIAGNFLFVDNPVNNLGTGIIDMVWNTRNSGVGFIWYVYVIFVFLVSTLLWLRTIKTKYSIAFLMIFALIIKALRLPGYYYLDLVGCYYIYFVMGCFAFQHKDKYYELISKYAYYFLVMAIAILAFYFYTEFHLLRFPIAVLAILAVHGIINTTFTNSNVLLKISKYIFSIYLFNVVCIGLSKALLLKFISWDGINFFVFLPTLFICGLFIPIFLKKYVFKKVSFLDKLTS